MPRRFNTCGEPAGKGGAVDHGADRSTAYRGAAFIGAVAILYLAFLAATGQVAQLVDALRAVQAPWLLAACASMLLYLVLGVAAYAVAVWCDPASPVGVRDLVSVEASGIFFGNLTPMMVGSTPAQIYRLTKAGQSVGEAGAVQFTRFMVYQFGLVAWSALLMAFRLPFFIERCGDIALLCAAAFGMHACILGGILAVGLLPGPIARAARAAIDLAARLGAPASRTEAWRAFVDREVESFSHTFRTAAGHVGSMAATVAITILQLAFFYLVPLLLMLAFGRSGVDVLTVMAASSFVQLLSSAVLLPGGTGGAEGGFALFLGGFFGPAAPAAYLTWRLITFIAPTIAAAPLFGLRSTGGASVRMRAARLLGGHRGVRGASSQPSSDPSVRHRFEVKRGVRDRTALR